MTKWLKFLFHHSIFISLCSVALCWETCLLLSIPVSIRALAVVFSATVFTYNIYSFIGLMLSNMRLDLKPISATLNVQQCISIVFILTSAMVVSIIAISLKELLLLLLIAAAFTLLYFVLIFNHRTRFILAKLPFIKPFILAGTWSLVTVFIPVCAYGNFSVPLLTSLVTHRFLFMLLLCMIFDSRDVDTDRNKGINTLFTSLTKIHVKRFFGLVLLMYSLSTIGMDYLQISHSQAFSLLLSGLLCWVLFMKSFEKKGYFFYHFWVDGIMIFSAFAVYVATI